MKRLILPLLVCHSIYAQQLTNSLLTGVPSSTLNGFSGPRFPMPSITPLSAPQFNQLPQFPMATFAPMVMPTVHTLPPFRFPPPVMTPAPPARAMAPVQVRYDPSPPRRVYSNNPNLAWRPIPRDRAYQSPDRYQPINFHHPGSIDQNYGYENDIGHIWYLCTTGNCGRGKK